jgi:hypothetical protein
MRHTNSKAPTGRAKTACNFRRANLVRPLSGLGNRNRFLIKASPCAGKSLPLRAEENDTERSKKSLKQTRIRRVYSAEVRGRETRSNSVLSAARGMASRGDFFDGLPNV